MKTRFILLLALAVGTVPVSEVLAATVGQVDTFEDGTTDGWVVGLLGAPHPAPPVNVPTGGPGGAGDNYLRLTSVGGSGAGNRLTGINLSQWAGDYTAAGIQAISMDVYNFGAVDLALRLAFSDAAGGPPADLAYSASPILLPAMNGWTSVLFPIEPGNLTPALGSVNAALANVTELRIFESVANTYPGESIAAQLGIDNIRAVGAVRPVPEISATFALLLGGVLSVGTSAARIRRRK